MRLGLLVPVISGALLCGGPAFAQVSDTIGVRLTIQTKPKEILVSGLDDIAIGYDGAAISGDPGDAFCLFADSNFTMKFASRNGQAGRFFLSGSGRPIVYDVNVRSGSGLTPITERDFFEHNIAASIPKNAVFEDRTCANGDNVRLEISFPEDGQFGLPTVTDQDLSDGKPHTYQDLLTVTLEPTL